MTALKPMHLSRRPVRGRVVVFYRVEPDVARGLLPSELRPRITAGSAIVVLCYTHLGRLETRFLPHRLATSHHLAYRVSAEAAGENGPTCSTWVAHRETSSRIGARWNEKVFRHGHGRSRFSIEDDACELTLRVESSRGDELFLRASACESTGTVFSQPNDVGEFFRNDGTIRPHGVFAREADVVDAHNAFVPEPLALIELRSAFFEDPDRFPSGSVAIDGAWRLTSTRTRSVRERTAHGAERGVLDASDSSPLPAV